MRRLFLLLIHPTHIVNNRGRIASVWIHFVVLGYAIICGLAFQHLYPRLLNNVPWLGFLRGLNPGNWNPRFDLELFLRGAGMGMIIILSFVLSFWVMSRIGKGKKLDWNQAYIASLASCTPVLSTCAIGFFFYYLYSPLGLIPVYGFFTASCLKILLFRDLLKLNRAVIVYLAPSLMAAQLYGFYLLLP